MIEFKKIIEEARSGNELPFNRFLKNLYTSLKAQLLSLTQSESEADEVFIESMQKFWEQFVVNDNALPKNPEAYIYTMCRNLWLIKKRNPWNKVILKDAFSDETSAEKRLDFSEKSEKSFLRQKSLTIALDRISDKCKRLIEINMDAGKKLKDFTESLGYTNYQALVQASYNCKKRLVKEVFKVLNELKNSKGHE